MSNSRLTTDQERQQAIGGSFAELARYEERYLTAHIPELDADGVPRFIILESGNPKNKDMFIERLEQLLPKAPFFLADMTDDQRQEELDFQFRNINATDKVMNGWVSKLPLSLVRLAGLHTEFGQPHNPSWTHVLIINNNLCSHCGPKAGEPRDAKQSPSERSDQFERLHTVEHEIGHMLNHRLGYADARSNSLSKSNIADAADKENVDAYLRTVEESAADVYADLRIIQIAGRHGLLQVQKQLPEKNFVPEGEGRLDHYSTAARLSAFRWASKHFDELQTMPPQQLAKLSNDFSTALSFKDIQRLSQSVTDGSGLGMIQSGIRDYSPQWLRDTWNSITGPTPEHVRRFDELRHQTDELSKTASVDLSKLDSASNASSYEQKPASPKTVPKP